MSCWMGKDYYLLFSCGDCGEGVEDIMIDLGNPKDMATLLKWLRVHSAVGGKYTTVKFIPREEEKEYTKRLELFKKMKARCDDV